ncbi:uracil phosphoribosyltransferase [Philodulcilactobacillus myokoensis]|uniref:Uracil phosphoribosyltransferase n=1 Tax=Philodulcilactobacillus myokoensis TaxID=2929573 RepID=A0A9W6ESD8_9LACO|nr:CopY/TcrY family copper transport repressor [Philodulcilactobacillus myokoensis]GLB46387.1 uracil phosphoribosyltransferase [Philodulcilactobacillus myokoensis]
MEQLEQITNSEWKIMRVIWTLGHSTSKQITSLLSEKEDWKASTVKTLLRRLDRKGFLKIVRKGRTYVYYSKIDEQTAANDAVLNIFHNICAMHAGKALNSVIQNVPISKNDIQVLIQTLHQKAKTAPDKVPCNCLKHQDCEGRKMSYEHEE